MPPAGIDVELEVAKVVDEDNEAMEVSEEEVDNEEEEEKEDKEEEEEEWGIDSFAWDECWRGMGLGRAIPGGGATVNMGTGGSGEW